MIQTISALNLWWQAWSCWSLFGIVNFKARCNKIMIWTFRESCGIAFIHPWQWRAINISSTTDTLQAAPLKQRHKTNTSGLPAGMSGRYLRIAQRGPGAPNPHSPVEGKPGVLSSVPGWPLIIMACKCARKQSLMLNDSRCYLSVSTTLTHYTWVLLCWCL